MAKKASTKAKTEKAKVEETKAPETPAAESKNANNVFVNNVHAKLIRDKGETAKIVSVPDAASTTGYGSIYVTARQLIPSTKKDGTPIPDRFNINLGNADRDIKYSIATGKDENGKTTYENKTVKPAEIAAKFDENRKEYFANKDAAKVEPQAETEAEANGPEVG